MYSLGVIPNSKQQNGTGLYSSFLNAIPSGDKTARKAYPGEKHVPLRLGTFRVGIANYVGPGTQVLKRLRRGDPPRSAVDKTAQRHDIDYGLAQGSKTKSEQIKKIREADIRMVKKLDNIKKNKKDYNINVTMGKAIAGKMIAEDVGIMKKGSFGGDLINIPNSDKDTLEKARDKLEQEGYGKVEELKMLLAKQYGIPSTKKKKKKVPTKKAQTGGSIDIIGSVLPALAKTLGITSLTPDSIKRLITPVIKGKKTMAGQIGAITRALLPVLVASKLKAHDEKATQKKVNELLAGKRGELTKQLGKALAAVIKQVKKGQGGEGLNQKGLGFWADFGRGFMAVMRPALPILATVLTPIAPEIGIPLGIVGTLIQK